MNLFRLTVSKAEDTAGDGANSMFCVIFLKPPSQPFCNPRGIHVSDGLFPGAGTGFTNSTVQLVVVSKHPVGQIEVNESHSCPCNPK